MYALYKTFISDAPSISLNKNSFIIEEGKSFSIPFTVEANPKPDGYALLFKNVIISNVFINSTIEFSNISRSQAGEYTIRISNNISEAFFNFNVDVRCEFQWPNVMYLL